MSIKQPDKVIANLIQASYSTPDRAKRVKTPPPKRSSLSPSWGRGPEMTLTVGVETTTMGVGVRDLMTLTLDTKTWMNQEWTDQS